MLFGGITLIIFFVAAAAISGAIIILSSLIGRRKPQREHRLPYECGLDPAVEPESRFSIKFFLVALLFIIFSIEIVLLYPIAVLFRDMVSGDSGWIVIAESMIFIGFFALAFFYAWGRGALEWER